MTPKEKEGSTRQQKYLKGSCMNQYHQTNKEEETSAILASSCYSVVLLYAQQKANGRKMVVERQPLNYRKENRKPNWPPHLTAAQRMSRSYRSMQDTAESVKELGTDGEERPAPGKCGSQRPAPAGGGYSRLRAPYPSAEPPRGQDTSAPSGPLAPIRHCIQRLWVNLTPCAAHA